MKTSNKLILIFFLSALSLYGAVHLALYARSGQGIVTNVSSEERLITKYRGKVPALVSLQGNVNVRLIPSDTFFIEYEKEESGKIHCREAGTDSLMIQGEQILINPHGIFQYYSDFPWVTVHVDPHTPIRLKDMLAIVKGRANSRRSGWAFQAINSQLWIGEAYVNEGDMPAAELYDSVNVDAVNTNLVLHLNAVVGHLSVQLDDKSELNDQHATIGKPEIRYTDRSKINLTGANLNKLQKETP